MFNVDITPNYCISLCTGYSGIELGLKRIIPNLRTIAYCEREAFAIWNLVKKIENGFLDSAPIYSDVSTFPWAEFHPIMGNGIVTGGFPCQPVSTAGRRKATEDERWLFDIIADGIAICEPRYVFLENVEGLLSAKMPDGTLVISHCVERLENLGYTVKVGLFSAEEVGAPHQRKRVFILAHRLESGLEGHPRNVADRNQPRRVTQEQGGYVAEGSSEMANPSRILQAGAGCGLGGECNPDLSQSSHVDDLRCNTRSGEYELLEQELGQSVWTWQSGEARDFWPARPGQQQYDWEPPRVIIPNSKRSNGKAGDAEG
jgi:DNA (cytosine-5)-methyltransferase 1